MLCFCVSVVFVYFVLFQWMSWFSGLLVGCIYSYGVLVIIWFVVVMVGWYLVQGRFVVVMLVWKCLWYVGEYVQVSQFVNVLKV